MPMYVVCDEHGLRRTTAHGLAIRAWAELHAYHDCDQFYKSVDQYRQELEAAGWSLHEAQILVGKKVNWEDL